MAAQAISRGPVQVAYAYQADFLEKAWYRKAFSCLPFLGDMYRGHIHRNLNSYLALDPHQTIEIIHLKNDYKITEIISRVLFVSLLIAGIALEVLTNPYVQLFGALSILENLYEIYCCVADINHNDKTTIYCVYPRRLDIR